jgi:hypothetical protein
MRSGEHSSGLRKLEVLARPAGAQAAAAALKLLIEPVAVFVVALRGTRLGRTIAAVWRSGVEEV